MALVVLPIAFDFDDPDACRECAERARAGKAFRRTDYWLRDLDCGAHLVIEDEDRTLACQLPEGHRGPHRDDTRATWSDGDTDYYPAPDGYV